jgi:hypothetical protein
MGLSPTPDKQKQNFASFLMDQAVLESSYVQPGLMNELAMVELRAELEASAFSDLQLFLQNALQQDAQATIQSLLSGVLMQHPNFSLKFLTEEEVEQMEEEKRQAREIEEQEQESREHLEHQVESQVKQLLGFPTNSSANNEVALNSSPNNSSVVNKSRSGSGEKEAVKQSEPQPQVQHKQWQVKSAPKEEVTATLTAEEEFIAGIRKPVLTKFETILAMQTGIDVV